MRYLAGLIALVLMPTVGTPGASATAAEVDRASYADVAAQVQPRMIKVFGSGGLRSLESYQSGFLISADGYVVTAWSYVLDDGEPTVILNDGRKFTGEIVQADPRREIAVLKIEAEDLPYFDLGTSKRLLPGSRVLAFSNIYGVATGDEPTSILHGVVSGITQLAARRGSFETPYKGDVYILDAMTNNAGAAGGALTDTRGRLVGILGKELRDARSGAWLNFAIPIDQIRNSVESILQGKTIEEPEDSKLPEEYASLDALGIVLIPNILRNTPPFVDLVLPNTPAAKTELQSDDLIVFVNGKTVSSQANVDERLREVDALDPVRITIVRDNELMEFEIEPR